MTGPNPVFGCTGGTKPPNHATSGWKFFNGDAKHATSTEPAGWSMKVVPAGSPQRVLLRGQLAGTSTPTPCSQPVCGAGTYFGPGMVTVARGFAADRCGAPAPSPPSQPATATAQLDASRATPRRHTTHHL